MHKMKMFCVGTAAALLLVACGQNNNSGGTNNNLAQGQFQAICNLENSTTALIVCEDFQTDSAANQAACVGGSEYTRYAADGVASSNYVGTQTSGAAVSCVTGGSNPTTGTCVLSDRTLVYYTSAWTSATAQTDCSSRNGQWGN